MAIVQLSFSTDMLNDEPWSPQVTSFESHQVTLGVPVYALTFTGAFASGATVSGTVDALLQTRNGVPQLQMSALGEDAGTLAGVVLGAHTRAEIYAWLLRGDDTVTGSAQPDLLAGLRGDDTLDGGGGIDAAFYTGFSAGYGISQAGSAHRVVDASGLDGSDTLFNVERLSFEDVSLALDLDANAGTVARVVGAVYGAAAVHNPALVGLGLRLLDTGTSAEALVQLALDQRLGVGHDPDVAIELLYTNVAHQAPTSAQVATYRSWLDSGAYTEASLALEAARSDANAASIDLIGLARGGLAFV